MNIFLIAGHSLLSPGATAQINETNETITLRDNIAYYLAQQQTHHLTDNDSMPLTQVITAINQQSGNHDIVIDLHFNAFNSHANGTEIYIHPDASSSTIKLAQNLLSTITTTLKTRSRGIKRPSQSQHQTLAILSKTHCSAIIVEICFADNPSDAQKYYANIIPLARNIAKTLTKHINSSTNR